MMRGGPMTYYISAKRFYFENKIKEGGYLAVLDGRFGDWSENRLYWVSFCKLSNKNFFLFLHFFLT